MPEQPELWIGLVEFRPFDKVVYGAAGTFSYIITWACDARGFREKANTIAATMDLYVMGIEGDQPLTKWLGTHSPLEEIEDMIQRAEFNPNAIVYGTFHRYDADQG